MKFGDVTVVVPVRKGSERVPRKNLIPFAAGADGELRNLLTWKLDQVTSVLSPDQVLVSSDWEEALEAAAERGCCTHVREPRLASRSAPFDQVIRAIAGVVASRHMVWMPATSPFFGSTCIAAALSRYFVLSDEEKMRGLVAVHRQLSYCFFGGAPLNFTVGATYVQSQDLQPVDVFDWAFSARPTRAVLRESFMFSANPITFPVSALENFDINEPLDFSVAQSLTALHLEISGEFG